MRALAAVILLLLLIGVPGAIAIVCDEWISDDPDDRRSIEARRRRDAALRCAEHGRLD